MATLDSLLALLEDNTSGAITAADVRTVVTDLRKRDLLSATAALFERPGRREGGLSTDAPTVTIGTSQTVTGRGKTWHNAVTELQSRGFFDNPNGRYKTQTGGALFSGGGVNLYGDTFEMVAVPAGATFEYFITVDGKPVYADWQVSPSGSGDRYIKLVFGSPGLRQVQVYATNLFGWKVVFTPHGSDVSPMGRLPVMGMVGDSFFGGSDGSPNHKSFGWHVAQAFGAEYGGRGLSGTGYSSSGGGLGVYGDPARVDAMVKLNPDLLIFVGSCNDDDNAATVQADATACFDAYAAALPDVPIVVFGPQPTGAISTLSANRQANNAALKAAAEAHPAVVAFFDMIGNADGPVTAWSAGSVPHGTKRSHLGSVWVADFQDGYTTSSEPGDDVIGMKWTRLTYGYDGTGRVGATAGNGTRDIAVHTDDLHPTVAGQQLLAAPVIEALRDLFASWR